jgi:predicted O-linked N-acetylglucosamine transferase (SPINDLY family)
MVWLSRNTSPLAHVVNFNLGATLSLENDIDGAETAYREAIRLLPGFVQPRVNLGTLLEGRGKIEEALTDWRWVMEHVSPQDPNNKPLVVMALNQMGRVLEIQKRLDEASVVLTKSLAIEPEQVDVLHHWVSLRQKQCVWPTYIPLPKVSRKFMQDATSALSTQRRCGRWATRIWQKRSRRPSSSSSRAKPRRSDPRPFSPRGSTAPRATRRQMR